MEFVTWNSVELETMSNGISPQIEEEDITGLGWAPSSSIDTHRQAVGAE